MAGYYKQCGCGRYADVVPCYNCLWEENKTLKSENRALKQLNKKLEKER